MLYPVCGSHSLCWNWQTTHFLKAFLSLAFNINDDVRRLDLVLNCLHKEGLKAKLEKVQYLGHVILHLRLFLTI